MPNIKNITQHEQPKGRHLFLKDGDSATFNFYSQGNEDHAFHEYTRHWVPSDNTYYTCKGVHDCPYHPDDKAQNRWATWVYVHEKKLFDGRTLEPCIYQVLSLPFGRSRYIWNQLMDIYEETGDLSLYVCKIKRYGDGLSTDWRLSSSNTLIDWDERRYFLEEPLPPIADITD